MLGINVKGLCTLFAAQVAVGLAFLGAGSAASAQSNPGAWQPRPYVTLSQIGIPNMSPTGIQVSELSALAWDQDEQLLYALSDKGILFHFRIKVEKNKILSADVVYAVHLLPNEDSAALHREFDTEGLALNNANNGLLGDTELIAASERTHHLIYLTPVGEILRKLDVFSPLDNSLGYQGVNKGLEAIAYHADHGVLTAPEVPLKGRPQWMHSIYAAQGEWSFLKYSKESRLKAIEVLPDGNLMVLERTKPKFASAKKSYLTNLQYVNLRDCLPGKPCQASKMTVLPKVTDNIEGLAYMNERQFLMVSDHSGENAQGGKLLFVTID